MYSLQRVFAVVPDCHARQSYYAGLWGRHFYQGIAGAVQKCHFPQGMEELWAESRDSESRIPLSPSDHAMANQKLAEQIEAIHRGSGLDAVVSYCYSSDIDSELVQRVKKLGVPWVNFFCDSTHMFNRVKTLASVTSLNWFPEHAAIERYQQLGAPYICAPYAFNPDYLPQVAVSHPCHTVGFVGLPTSNRITQLGWLRLLGQRVIIRGRGWTGGQANPFESRRSPWERLRGALLQPHLAEKAARRILWPMVRRQAEGELNDKEFFVFLAQCQMILGLNQGRDEKGRLMSYLKFRDMEFPGYGCCYVTEYNEDIASVFELGREVLAFRTLWEAARTMREIEKEPERLQDIRKAARVKVLNRHIWKARLVELAQGLGTICE